MNPQSQVRALEALLQRIQRNAANRSPRSAQTSSNGTAQELPSVTPEVTAQSSQSEAPLDSVQSVRPSGAPSGYAEVNDTVDDTIESLPPEEVVELIEGSAPPSAPPMVDTPAAQSGQSFRAPGAAAGTDEPGKLELELTDELSDAPSDLRSSPPPVTAPSADATDATRTPPPESGPQISPAAPAPDFSRPLAADDAAVGEPAGHAPTMSQLGGNTVELPESAESASDLELDAPAADAGSQPDEYEANLPEAQFAGAYDESLKPPPNAQQDLEAHDRAQRELETRSSSVGPAVRPPPEPAGEPAPVTIARPPPAANIEAPVYEGHRPSLSPVSFLTALDRSLKLGGR